MRSPAASASSTPLVVSARSRTQGLAASSATSDGRSRRSSGSPPVSRTRSTPSFAEEIRELRDLLEREHVLARQPEVLVLRHAVVAPQVAAVGHRQAETAQRPAERVDDGTGDYLMSGTADVCAGSEVHWWLRILMITGAQLPSL